MSVRKAPGQLGSFWHGTMAAATPLGLGAQAVDLNRQVVVLAGDGGLAMMLGELLTAVQHRLPIKIVVVDNAALSFVEVEMKAAGIVSFGPGCRIRTSVRWRRRWGCTAKA